jgi:uncharacterized protein (TIGR02594 family)
MSVATTGSVGIFPTIKATLTERVAFASAGVAGFGAWASWRLWIKDAGSLVGDLLPFISFAVLGLTLWKQLRPRPVETEKPAKAVASFALKTLLKRAGILLAAVVAVFAVLLFWKSDAKAAPVPQQLVSAPAGKRKRSNDDAGDEGDADDVQDPNELAAPPWFWKAKSYVGVCERLDNGRANPDVRVMFEAVNGFKDAQGNITADPRKVAWCMVFVNFVFKLCGVSGTGSAMARSVGRSRAFKRLDEPRIGCIVTMWRGQHDDGQTGHVGFYAGDAGLNYIWVLGGNQGDQVKIAKFPKSRTRGAPDLGYWWPRGKWESRQAQAAAVGATAGAAGTGAVAYSELTDTPEARVPGVPDGVSLDAATKTLEQIQQPLEMTGHPKAMKIAALIGVAIMALSVGAVCFNLWRHSRDHSEGKL